jgi:hypothetical protein
MSIQVDRADELDLLHRAQQLYLRSPPARRLSLERLMDDLTEMILKGERLADVGRSPGDRD